MPEAARPTWTRLFLDEEMSGPRCFPIAGGQAAVYSASRPDADLPNEDAAGLVTTGPRGGVFMVADGVGGSRGGRQAAHRVLELLARQLEPTRSDEGSRRTAILDGIESANRRLLEAGTGGATTLALVEVDGDKVRSYHVGDSAVLLLGQRGRLKLQTIDHSIAGYGLEAGMLDEDEALHHEDRHVVLNVVGSTEMRIEVGATLRLAPRDTLILASDGLMDNLRVEEIVSLLRRGRLPTASRALVDQARARMAMPGNRGPSKPDDLTVVVFRRYGLGDLPPSPPRKGDEGTPGEEPR